jgi:hypothetical protein
VQQNRDLIDTARQSVAKGANLAARSGTSIDGAVPPLVDVHYQTSVSLANGTQNPMLAIGDFKRWI